MRAARIVVFLATARLSLVSLSSLFFFLFFSIVAFVVARTIGLLLSSFPFAVIHVRVLEPHRSRGVVVHELGVKAFNGFDSDRVRFGAFGLASV